MSKPDGLIAAVTLLLKGGQNVGLTLRTRRSSEIRRTKVQLKLAHICIANHPQTYLIKYSKEVVGTLRPRGEGSISTDK